MRGAGRSIEATEAAEYAVEITVGRQLRSDGPRLKHADIGHGSAQRRSDYRRSAVEARCQVRKNMSQTMARTRTASAVEAARSARTEGPGSAWRASVGVSTVRPCRSFVAISKTFPLRAGLALPLHLRRALSNCSGSAVGAEPPTEWLAFGLG
jgi:hypothetical protein